MVAVRALNYGVGALDLTRVGAVESCGSAEKTSAYSKLYCSYGQYLAAFILYSIGTWNTCAKVLL